MKALILNYSNFRNLPLDGELDATQRRSLVRVGETPTSEGTEIPGVVSLRLTPIDNFRLDLGLACVGAVKFELEVEVYVTSHLPTNAKPIAPDKLQCPRLLLALEGDTSRTVAFGLAQRLKNVDSRYSNEDIALLASMTQEFRLDVHCDKINTATLFGHCLIGFTEDKDDAPQAS